MLQNAIKERQSMKYYKKTHHEQMCVEVLTTVLH